MRWSWVLVAALGCTGGVEDSTESEEIVPIVDTGADDDHATDGWLRAVHLAPDLAAPCDHDANSGTPPTASCVALYLTPSPIPLNDTPFPAGASTGFALPVVPGTYAFEVRAWGASPSTDPAFEGTTTVNPSEGRTIVTYGLSAASSLGVTYGTSDLRAPATGNARIDVFHANNALTLVPLDVVLGTGIAWDGVAFGTFGGALVRSAATGVAFGVSVDGDAAAEYAATLDLADGGAYDVFLFDTGNPVAPVVALVHTPTSQQPTQVVLLPTGM